jgi:hypothetical protein
VQASAPTKATLAVMAISCLSACGLEAIPPPEPELECASDSYVVVRVATDDGQTIAQRARGPHRTSRWRSLTPSLFSFRRALGFGLLARRLVAAPSPFLTHFFVGVGIFPRGAKSIRGALASRRPPIPRNSLEAAFGARGRRGSDVLRRARAVLMGLHFGARRDARKAHCSRPFRAGRRRSRSAVTQGAFFNAY